MYAGVDIGGTKTLVAVFSEQGDIIESAKFPTSPDYATFLLDLAHTVDSFTAKEFTAGALAMPVTTFDREHGIGVAFGNLPWKNVPIHSDAEKILNCPVAIDNDAKLGGLYEAILLKDQFKKVLYVTVSTGIGYAVVTDGIIDENAGDGGGRTILLEHNETMVPWEDFASGHAIVERYGKKAMDITDDETWQRITHDLSLGLIELIAVFEPEVIVIGGSVGTYFERYGKFLEEELKSYEMPLVPMPALLGAQNAEEAVVYGCYNLAAQRYADEKSTN